MNDETTFDIFWRAYPRHVAKKDAEKAWRKLNPSADLMQRILLALDWQRDTPDWQKEHGSFVPYPASWIRGERWTDEPKRPLRREPREHWSDECARLHGGRCGNRTFHAAKMAEQAEA